MNQPSPEPTGQSANDASQEAPQGSVFSLFGETFLLLGRYFLIVYPVFLYFIISSLMVPRTAPDFGHWAWWVISLGLLGILFIFKAGWNHMMYKAVEDWQELKQKATQPEGVAVEMAQIPFRILKEFIPGIGVYGPSFLIGGFVWVIFIALPVVLLAWLGYQYIGIPEFFQTLLTRPELTPQEVEQAMQSLTPTEKSQISSWNWLFLLALVLLAVVNALTLFWQQYIILRQCNPFKAFVYSARQALSRPFNTVVILLYFSFFYFVFTLMGGFSSLMAFLGNFMLIITIVFFGLFMFLYLLRVDAQLKA
jgi:hypothetical protein